MLAKFVPGEFWLNDKFDIIQFRGATRKLAGPTAGQPSYNILKIARNGLLFELRNLLQQAKKKTNLLPVNTEYFMSTMTCAII